MGSNSTDMAIRVAERAPARDKASRDAQSARASAAGRRAAPPPPPAPGSMARDRLSLSAEARPRRRNWFGGWLRDPALDGKKALVSGGIATVVTAAVLALSGLPLLPAIGVAAMLVVPAMALTYGAVMVADWLRQRAATRPAASSSASSSPATPNPPPPARSAATERGGGSARRPTWAR